MKESDLQGLFDVSSELICVFDAHGHFQLVNPAWEKTMGFASQELRSNTYLDFVHADDRAQSAIKWNRIISGETAEPFENRFRCKDGSYRWLQWNATAVPQRSLIYGIARDVSAAKTTEKTLRASERKYRSIVEDAAEGILQTTPAGQIVMANPVAARMLGYEHPAELTTGEVDFERHFYVDPEDRAHLLAQLEHQGAATLECQLHRRDGSTIWVSLKARAVRDSNGGLQYFEKFIEDVTNRRLAEEKLKESEATYRSLIENAMLGIYRSSLDGRFLEVNHALAALLGYESREELLAQNLERDIYLRPDERSYLIRRYGNVERIKGRFVRWKRKDGTPISVRLSGRKVRDNSGTLEGFEVIVEEVREYKFHDPSEDVTSQEIVDFEGGLRERLLRNRITAA